MNTQKKTIAEEAWEDFAATIRCSWTYERLTDEEREEVEDLLDQARMGKILGGEYTRCCKQMSIIYRAYLWGLGFRRDTSVDWRQPSKA